MKRQIGLSEMMQRRVERASRRAVRGALGWRVWSSEGDLQPRSRRGRELRTGCRRRGSTLLVVMALLGMLMLLGMLYFTFANQEMQNATNFAEAAKKPAVLEDNIEAIFNESIRQLILGGDYAQKNSALWGGRHSLLATLSGQRTVNGQWTRQPYAGLGTSASLFAYGALNDSPAANNYIERNLSAMAGSNIDHTYPDLNNMFLAYEAATWDLSTTPPTRFPIPAIKPSFHPSPLLRDFSTSPPSPISNWAIATGTTSTKSVLFRPHPEHLYVWRQGSAAEDANGNGILDPGEDRNGNGVLDNPPPVRRFIIDAASNPSADPTLANFVTADAGFIGTSATTQVSSAFPFLTDRDGDSNFSEQGVWSKSATTPVIQYDAYDFDVDTDGDGYPDAIWMDLDLPVLTRPSDGRTYIPLIAFKVLDLDGLINLNTSGNLSGQTRTAGTTGVPFGNGSDISRSSMGLSPSEINPIWALDAVPGTVAGPNVDFVIPAAPNDYYFKYFARNPASALEAGNMEWWWLNKGRVDYLAPNVIWEGRLGEANRLWQVLNFPNAINAQLSQSNLFPFAGAWDQDDNRDFNEGGPLVTAGLAAGQGLPFKHPLALNGVGRFWTGPKTIDLLAAVGGGNPSRFLRYTNMGIGDDGTGGGTVALLNSPLAAALMVTPRINATFGDAPPPAQIDPNGSTLVDDMNELTVDPKFDSRPYDNLLSPSDTLLLFMNQADRSSTGIQSRVRDLMPGNIDTGATGASPYLEAIGRRFTTTSWDLKQFALTSNPVGFDGRFGVANVDDDGDGQTDNMSEIGYSGSDDGPRAWEWNVDSNANGKPEWPPQFNPPANFQPSQPENAFGYLHNGTSSIKQDPFRPQLRRLLETEFNNTAQARLPMRLSVNEFLDVEHTPGVPLPAPANSQQYADYFRLRPLKYRPLTPHSTDTAASDPAWGSPPVLPTPFASANVGNPLPTYPPQTEPEIEFWARRDRQQMARDIYVLLYTFCGGNNSVNVTNTAGDTAYPVNAGLDMRRQMAQVAVNLVDALDRDNVITAFEYDRDLSNGWDLDDDITTADGGTDRAVVFGVEAQELTFSEVMWLWQDQDTVNHALTPFDETTGIHHFFQIELRSVSPFSVPLSTTSSTPGSNTAVWRIHRYNDSAFNTRLGIPGGLGLATTPLTVPANENVLSFLNGVGSVSPGGLFTIANADSSPVGAATLYVDYTGAATDFEIVAPNVAAPAHNPATTPVPAPVANLDLIHTGHSTRFELANAGPGEFLNRTNNPDGAGAPPTTAVQLRLERRLNPYLPQLSLAANPFVLVDTYRGNNGNGIAPRQLKIDSAVVTQTDANQRLGQTGTFGMPPYPAMESRERDRPMVGRIEKPSTGGGGPSPHRNTIGQNNSPPLVPFPTEPFTYFQPHFDRDFASTIELFNLYLIGPTQLVANDFVRQGRESPFTANPVTFGQATILQTEDQDGDGTLTGSEDLNGDGEIYSNHFHRLLSMVEVPTRTHRQLGDPLKVNRVPGRINLNTVRDPRVLGALIDDRQVIGQPEHTGADFNGDTVIDEGLKDITGDTSRDWWIKFLEARDGVDPTSNLLLPGVLGLSQPFRDVGHLSSTGGSSINDTILRSLPGTGVGRRLFELVREDNSEFQNGAIEPILRHKLLSKIYGNSTTRSNCFVVFVTIGMFECVQYTPPGAPEPVVRIGGPLALPSPPNPANTQETYRAMFLIDRSESEQSFDPGGTTFDWQKMVMAKQRVN